MRGRKSTFNRSPRREVAENRASQSGLDHIVGAYQNASMTTRDEVVEVESAGSTGSHEVGIPGVATDATALSTSEPTREFQVFLSYRHDPDERLATELQKLIHSGFAPARCLNLRCWGRWSGSIKSYFRFTVGCSRSQCTDLRRAHYEFLESKRVDQLRSRMCVGSERVLRSCGCGCRLC